MVDNITQMVLMIVGLQAKHIICDGPLQTLVMVKSKSSYGAPQGLLHGLIHALGTAIVLVLFGLPLQVVAFLALIDGIVHYHVDFIKENVVKLKAWRTDDGPFWWALTTDQTLHHLTYVLLAWWVFKP